MEAKLFEIRDDGTYMVALAVRLYPGHVVDRHLLASAGYGTEPETQGEYIVFAVISGGVTEATTDPYGYRKARGRTRTVAHGYVRDHWSELQSGDVVDVEFILGETQHPKLPQRETHPLRGIA